MLCGGADNADDAGAVSVSVTCVVLLPGVTLAPAGNCAVAPVGRPVTLSCTGSLKPSAVGVIVNVTSVACPGVSITGADGPLSEKSSSVKAVGGVAPPPGVGLVTITFTVPGLPASAAEMDAVSCDALTKVVVSFLLLKLMTELERKFVPLTVRVKALPAGEFPGDTLLMLGAGLFTDNVVEPVTPEIAACTVVVPAVRPVANPVDAPMVATEGLDDVHATVVVMVCVLPSL